MTSLTLAAVAVGAVVAGCGGSGSTAPGVALAPSAGATQGAITTAPATTSTTSTTSSASVPTPTSGPLSTEPKVPAAKGTPPKTLQTKDLITGTGATAKSGSTVTVNYVGALYKNGKIFDASWNRKQTFTTQLSNSAVIPGWVQGISGMKVGGRRVLIIPPALGYGKTGSPPTIPGNSTLVFVVDLLKVA
ncbi:MAG TPA: FKBP-type peptidyl-prolyl cis-trans isomerase [Solirubrobacteraceae bacterium]|jgi:peptidylprolyl isomerase|nr:FKBP-type peptidyl-prolyl cis-trans isomerase [Solirubrobacteraceae bacterium]